MNIVRLGPGYYAQTAIGRPVANGDIYVGIVDLDPEIVGNQLQLSVQQEDGTIVNVAQPISTGGGGVPLYNGSPVTLLVDSNYSLKVLDKSGSQVYYVPSVVGNETFSTSNKVSISFYGNSLTTAISEIGADEITLWIDTTVTLTADDTVPANITLEKTRAGIFTGAQTLTINGGMTGDMLSQWFNSNVTVEGKPDIETVSPTWFGENTVPGTTDTTLTIQAAIDFAAQYTSKTQTVLFTAEDWLYSQITVSTDRLVLKGVGASTRLISNSATLSGIVFEAPGVGRMYNNGISDMTLGQATNVSTAGACLYMERADDCVVENLFISTFPIQPYIGIWLDDVIGANFHNISIQSQASSGIFIEDCIDITMSDSKSAANGGSGFRFVDTEGVYFTNVVAYQNQQSGFSIDEVVGAASKNMFFTNCIADSSYSYNWFINSLLSGFFTNCWGVTQHDAAVNTFANGFYFGANTSRLFLTNCIANNNNSHGYNITTGSEKISLTNSLGEANGQAAAVAGSGCYVQAGTDHIISGNRLISNGSGHGLYIEAVVTNLIALGNSTLSNGVGQVFNGSSSVILRNGIGYVTENSGSTNAIATGAIIAHGLDAAPTAVSLTSLDAGVTSIYYSADATNITVNYSGGGTHAFNWEAKVR